MKKLLIISLLVLSKPIFSNEIASIKKSKQTIKVALLLDTSNSMDGLINQAKAQLWEIVNELSYAKYGIQKPDLKIALYEYGNDKLEPKEGFIRQVLPFSSDLDEISEKLFSLTTHGGSEYCGQVIQTSLKELDWGTNENDLKLIFIAGNEPFTQGSINYVEAINDAKSKDILVNTIFCGNYTTGITMKWKEGADLGGGDYMTIDHTKTIIHIVTPYDSDIILLNKKLNDTYIYYGNMGYQKYSNQKMQDANAEKLNEETAVKRTISKSSRLYENSSWDLVDAYNQNKIDLKSLDKNLIPKELQTKSIDELKQIIIAKSLLRKEIQEQIKILEKKRRLYETEKRKENPNENMLNNAIINAIKKQAKLKNYSW